MLSPLHLHTQARVQPSKTYNHTWIKFFCLDHTLQCHNTSSQNYLHSVFPRICGGRPWRPARRSRSVLSFLLLSPNNILGRGRPVPPPPCGSFLDLFQIFGRSPLFTSVPRLPVSSSCWEPTIVPLFVDCMCHCERVVVLN